MKKVLLSFVCILAAVALMTGCGGKKQESRTARLLEDMDEDVDLVEDLTGIDDSTPVAVEQERPSEEPTEQASEEPTEAGDDVIGGSDGVFVGTIKVAGETVKGRVTVRRATVSNEVVKKDLPSGTEIKLAPGSYDFGFSTDKVVGGLEYVLRDVQITAGRRVKRDVKIPVGKITLVTGARCSKKAIRIKAKGATDWLKGKYYTCQELLLKAGNYEAEMGAGRKAIPITGIQVYDGGVREILIRKQQ